MSTHLYYGVGREAKMARKISKSTQQDGALNRVTSKVYEFRGLLYMLRGMLRLGKEEQKNIRYW